MLIVTLISPVFGGNCLLLQFLCSFTTNLCCLPIPDFWVSTQCQYLLHFWDRLWVHLSPRQKMGWLNTVLCLLHALKIEGCSFTVGRIPWDSLLPWTIREKQRESCTGMMVYPKVGFPLVPSLGFSVKSSHCRLSRMTLTLLSPVLVSVAWNPFILKVQLAKPNALKQTSDEQLVCYWLYQRDILWFSFIILFSGYCYQYQKYILWIDF